MFKDKLTEFLHRQEVIFSQVYRRKKIGEKLIKWLCVSCLATLNYSCLFDCCVWRIYWEVEHQGRRCLSWLLEFNFQRQSSIYVKYKGALNSHQGIWIYLLLSIFLFSLLLLIFQNLVLLSFSPYIRSFCCSFTLLVILVWSQCQHSWLNLSASYLWTTTCVS